MESKKYLIIIMLVLLSTLFSGCIVEQDNDDISNQWNPEFDVEYSVNVTYIVDGDIFDAILPSGKEERIRLLGVDVPELTPSKNNKYEYGNITDLECLASFSSEAKSFAESWLNKETISIQFDDSAGFKGYYGRWLAYVYLPNGTDFNVALLESGFARVYEESIFEKELSYIELQNDAINNKIGLWGCISSEQNDENNSNDNSTNDTNTTTRNNISIACWNLQIFGPSKASNDTLLNYYAEKLDDYDIFIVQEIRDVSGNAIETLAEKFPDYAYIISNRAGQSSSKEQYAVFYNDQATLINSYDYQAEYQQDMQRPPLKATFTSNNWTFTLYTIHTQPDNVPGELNILETIVGNPSGDTIILGDLNADGSYYNEDNIAHFTDWNWIVTNDIDTTVATSDNTYDRIIINDATENNFISFGVMDDVNNDQSDHYLVYAIFNNMVG